MKISTKIFITFILTAFALALLYAQPYHVGSCEDEECYLYLLNRLTPALKGYNPRDLVLFRSKEKVEAGRILALGGDILGIAW